MEKKFFYKSKTALCIYTYFSHLTILDCMIFLHTKNPQLQLWVFFCGERGIRTPGGVTLNSFQDCRIRPLCHFSFAVANIHCLIEVKKLFFIYI